MIFAWLGALAAVADLAQNVSLAIALADPQPWSTISAVADPTTTVLGATAAVFALGGAVATRSPGDPA
jgi:hypothetical protein